MIAVFVIAAGIGALVTILTTGGSTGRSHHRDTTAASTPKPRSTPKAVTRTTATQPKPLVTTAAANNFAALMAGLPGRVGLALAPIDQGPLQKLGPLQEGHAWSTMKVPVLVTLLRDYARVGKRLTAQQQTEAKLALEQSDNAAAETLFAELEHIHGGLVPASEAVQHTLAVSGDTSTTVNTAANNQGFTTWGQTLWPPADEVVFYRSLARGCLIGPGDTNYVLELMRSVTPSQRWGAGAAGYPGSLEVGFKGGWGPEQGGGYLVRQTAVIGSESRGYVLSMAARPSDGSFASGVSMITALAKWARQNISLETEPPPGGCTGA